MDYFAMAETAKRMLTDYGKTIVVSRVVSNVYDTYTGEMTTTKTEQSCKAVFTKHDKKDIDRSLIMATDSKVIIDPTIELETNDTIDDNGKQYVINHVLNEINPAGIGIAWIVSARKI